MPCSKIVKAVGGSKLTCIGWIPAIFNICGNSTKQPVYVCEKVDRFYFSREGCSEANILPPSFPFPMPRPDELNQVSAASIEKRPFLPCPATTENIPKLKEHLIKSFPTVFAKSSPFRAMRCPPVHIHLKEDAQPYARHVPITIPVHWRDTVKADIDRDVENGVIEPVPIGEPVSWCSPMVVAAKKDGRPRRTVDLQRLNAQCLRETHHCEPPFKLALQVPAGTFKTVIDAKDGYHSIELDEESRPLTTFITPWGRYRYRRLPQGYVAAGDAYTRRYDEIIKNVERKVKCIDDALLYDYGIEESYIHTWQFLSICASDGITVNLPKFQFCQKTVDFAGLVITPTGVRPSSGILSAIEKFPIPENITSARSWYGLINQVSWAYSNSEVMRPFRELVKHDSQFHWDATLADLFEKSKRIIVKQVEEGIRTFDTKRNTCLQTDWSKDGIGYLLLQQYCECKSNKAPLCCKEGWKLVFAGSRVTRGAECNYAPIEGEALAVAWSLEHARMFVLGCGKLRISTDHKPLIGLLGNRELGSIDNNRLRDFKQRTLPYQFTISYNPGKWHRGPDAMSRNAVSEVALLQLIRDDVITEDDDESTNTIAFFNTVKTEANINLTDICKAASTDDEYKLLSETIRAGFPTSRNEVKPILRDYWSVRDRLSIRDGDLFMADRVVIPKSLRQHVTNGLHAAHQGVSSMLSRARQVVYWPSMENDLRNKRYKCYRCNEIAPSQPKEPLLLAPAPDYPFQQIATDYFEIAKHSYLSIVDRFSGWIIVYHFSEHARSDKLIEKCRKVFEAYGVAEEISSDGGPQFVAQQFKKFLEDWGVRHRISSAHYPQSNGRAEVGVKAAKRIIYDNTAADGSLNSDKATRAMLQYRNTPQKDIGLSPAQMLLHRQLRDHLPADAKLYQPNREWLISATDREKAFEQRNERLASRYNQSAHPLPPLSVQTPVLIQTKRGTKTSWNRSGVIVEVLPYRQFRIKMDGSNRLVLRNRRYLKPIANRCPIMPPICGPDVSPPVKGSGTIEARNVPSNNPPVEEQSPNPEPDSSVEPPESSAQLPESEQVTDGNEQASRRLPKALRDIADFNKKGQKEEDCSVSSRLRTRR